MAMTKSDAVWVEIDPATLDVEQQDAYRAYKEAYAKMKALRQGFQGLMAIGVPTGQRMIFGYNFGKLSVAIVPDDRKQVKPKQAKLSLAEYMAQAQASGLRA